jgi:hypothetical protein
MLQNENDYFAGLDSFAGVRQCKTIRATDEIAIGERFIRLTSVLQNDAGLVGNVLVGTLEEGG